MKRRSTRWWRRRGDQRGTSALEVMLAIVLLSTAILGAAAAQAASWRVLAGGRRDAGAWAALHYQVEELVSGGYDRLASGYRVLNGYPIQWDVAGTDPKVVLIVARHPAGWVISADTVRLVVRPPPGP